MIGPLFVKVIFAPAIPGNRALALCTEDGVLVGYQESCEVNCEVDSISTVTVKFLVDGDKIRFSANDLP